MQKSIGRSSPVRSSPSPLPAQSAGRTPQAEQSRLQTAQTGISIQPTPPPETSALASPMTPPPEPRYVQQSQQAKPSEKGSTQPISLAQSRVPTAELLPPTKLTKVTPRENRRPPRSKSPRAIAAKKAKAQKDEEDKQDDPSAEKVSTKKKAQAKKFDKGDNKRPDQKQVKN